MPKAEGPATKKRKTVTLSEISHGAGAPLHLKRTALAYEEIPISIQRSSLESTTKPASYYDLEFSPKKVLKTATSVKQQKKVAFSDGTKEAAPVLHQYQLSREKENEMTAKTSAIIAKKEEKAKRKKEIFFFKHKRAIIDNFLKINDLSTAQDSITELELKAAKKEFFLYAGRHLFNEAMGTDPPTALKFLISNFSPAAIKQLCQEQGEKLIRSFFVIQAASDLRNETTKQDRQNTIEKFVELLKIDKETILQQIEELPDRLKTKRLLENLETAKTLLTKTASQLK